MSYHAELQELLDNHRNPVLALRLPTGMVDQAETLLALSEESLAALVSAAQSMVTAVSFADRPPCPPDHDPGAWARGYGIPRDDTI